MSQNVSRMQNLENNISTAHENVTTCQAIVKAKLLEYKNIKEKLQQIIKEDREGKASLDAAIQSLQQARNQRTVAEQEMDNYIQSSSDSTTPSTPRRSGLRPRNNNAATQMNATLSLFD